MSIGLGILNFPLAFCCSCCGFIPGALGIVLGSVAYNKGDEETRRLGAIGIALCVLSILLGIVMFLLGLWLQISHPELFDSYRKILEGK